MQPPSSLTREQVEATVMSSALVQAAIEKTTGDAASGAPSGRDDARKAAKEMFASMYADVQQPTVRSAIYVMRKVWRTMYEGIRVNEDGIQMLHEFAAERTPVVLLPMHKSHVDYLLLTYVCAAYNLFPLVDT